MRPAFKGTFVNWGPVIEAALVAQQATVHRRESDEEQMTWRTFSVRGVAAILRRHTHASLVVFLSD